MYTASLINSYGHAWVTVFWIAWGISSLKTSSYMVCSIGNVREVCCADFGILPPLAILSWQILQITFKWLLIITNAEVHPNWAFQLQFAHHSNWYPSLEMLILSLGDLYKWPHGPANIYPLHMHTDELIPIKDFLILNITSTNMYAVRALFNHLQWHYHGVPWPSVTLPSSDLLNHLVKRINEASVRWYEKFVVSLSVQLQERIRTGG